MKITSKSSPLLNPLIHFMVQFLTRFGFIATLTLMGIFPQAASARITKAEFGPKLKKLMDKYHFEGNDSATKFAKLQGLRPRSGHLGSSLVSVILEPSRGVGSHNINTNEIHEIIYAKKTT